VRRRKTRSWPCSQSKSRNPAQQVGVVSESALGMRMELGVTYTAADGKGLEDDSNARQRDSYATYIWIMFN
jgi:hypothetical protein